MGTQSTWVCGKEEYKNVNFNDYENDYADVEGEWIWVGDYNCYINHYNAWYWHQLGDWKIEQLETLGYTQEQWDFENATDGNDPNKPYNEDWQNLKLAERDAADGLCFTQYVWDNWGLEGEVGFCSKAAK